VAPVRLDKPAGQWHTQPAQAPRTAEAAGGGPLRTAGSSAVQQERRSRRPLVLFLVFVLVMVVALGLYRMARDAPAGAGDGDTTSPAEATVAAAGLQFDAVIDGDAVQMTEATQLADPGVAAAELRVPQLTGLSGAAGSARLEVTDLVVSLDGQQVEPTQDPAVPGVWQVTRSDGAPFRQMQVAYRLSGAVVASPLSAEGRMLAVLGPLSPPVPDLPTLATVRGAGVLNVFCPGVAADALLCATQNGDAWDAEMAGSDPGGRILLVQIDRG